MHPDTLPTFERNWVACYNMVLNRFLGNTKASASGHPIKVIAIGVRSRLFASTTSASSYYAGCEKIRFVHMLSRCSLEKFGGDRERHQLALQQPLRFQQSHDVVASFWEDVRQGAHVQLFMLPVLLASNTDSASYPQGPCVVVGSNWL